MTDRRTFIAALATAPVVVAIPAMAAPSIDYMAQLRKIDLWTIQLDNSDATNEEWDRWSEETSRVWREIAALPATPENARIKARCVHSICHGRLEDVIGGDSTAERLARQVIAIMGAQS